MVPRAIVMEIIQCRILPLRGSYLVIKVYVLKETWTSKEDLSFKSYHV